ncbi:MAG TPA: hypothetical protein VNX18_18490 [Bryobacteraceae bacterium]|nr:hypothetical protein [Bryobacteraceae bacterium]
MEQHSQQLRLEFVEPDKIHSLGRSTDANYPQLCFEVGLTCEGCTAETARQLAQACKGLRGKAIGQLFVQIHPHSACARMHRHFSACYLEASTERSQVIAAVA